MSEISGALYKNFTASNLVATGNGKVYGVVINSHTGGTLKLWDNTSAAGTVIINTYTFPAGSGTYIFPEPICFVTGLYATKGGTIDATIIFNQN